MDNFSPSDKYSSQLLVRILASDAELTDRLAAAKNKLSKFALTCAEIGTKMEGLGQSLSAPFTRAISILADFDDQMRRVAAVTGAAGGKTARPVGLKAALDRINNSINADTPIRQTD